MGECGREGCEGGDIAAEASELGGSVCGDAGRRGCAGEERGDGLVDVLSGVWPETGGGDGKCMCVETGDTQTACSELGVVAGTEADSVLRGVGDKDARSNSGMCGREGARGADTAGGSGAP